MLVVTRLRIPAQEEEAVTAAARDALSALAQRPGFLSGDLGRAVDDPDLWLLSSRWAGAGHYRRGLSSFDVKVALAPLMAFVVPEPSAYAVVARVDSRPPD